MVKNALIIAPFMNRSHHVGGLRVGRFVRWLGTAGYHVTLVRAGQRFRVEMQPWGEEIVIADPLGLHSDQAQPAPTLRRKEYGPLVEHASRLLFNPDPAIMWGRRVRRVPEVLSAAATAELVISSSPPESSHLTALHLARQSRAKLIIDMRDGWLDEPLKSSLASSKFQRWREAPLEKRVLQAAHRVFVTSPVWQQLLLARYPELSRKLAMLPNCYPLNVKGRCERSCREGHELVLLHAGQFRGSKYNNRPELLLGPLIETIRRHRLPCRIICHGRFSRQDLADLENHRQSIRETGGSLELHPPLAYEAMLEAVSQADGLLLLSATSASLPAKLYEYIPSRRPILAATLKHSAVWQMSALMPQMHAFPIDDTSAEWRPIEKFLEDCRTGSDHHSMIPEEFTDAFVSQQFLKAL